MNAKICLTYKVTRCFPSKYRKSISSYSIELHILFNLANDFLGAEFFLINSSFLGENRIHPPYVELETSFPYSQEPTNCP
jgi:hypothetical protein